jgi:hypothetical protein
MRKMCAGPSKRRGVVWYIKENAALTRRRLAIL